MRACFFCRFLRRSIKEEMSAGLLDGFFGGTTPRARRFFSSSSILSAWPSYANHAPSTFVHIVADNAWQRQTQFSTPLLAVGYGRDCCQLFSISAKTVASCRQSSQVYLAYSDEKRTITRPPITDSDGNISLFQLLWKGTTDLCPGNCWTRHFAKFRSGFISHSGLKITWEISHKFEMRNIPQRNNPAAKTPPPPVNAKMWKSIPDIPSLH